MDIQGEQDPAGVAELTQHGGAFSIGPVGVRVHGENAHTRIGLEPNSQPLRIEKVDGLLEVYIARPGNRTIWRRIADAWRELVK